MTAFSTPRHIWNQRFATGQYIFGEEPNANLHNQVAHLHKGSALAVTDGEGRNGVWLAEQGLRINAFAFSENVIQKVRLLAERHQQSVHWQCSDWQSFEWGKAHYNKVVGISPTLLKEQRCFPRWCPPPIRRHTDHSRLHRCTTDVQHRWTWQAGTDVR